MCSRDIIAIAEYNTQVAQVVQRCGIVVSPGDVSAFVDAVVYLATHPQKCTQLGETGRQFAVTHWRQKVILEQLEQKFTELCSTPTPESVSVDAVMLERSLKSDTQENPPRTIHTKPIGS